MDIKRICLWSGPRNISTALMYSFAQRSDTCVYDEPLYAHYLRNSEARNYHPGSDEILATMENEGSKVVDMMLGEHLKQVAFFKQMTHHLVDLDLSFLSQVENVILTRDPREMLPSYAKAVQQPTLTDAGYKQHIDLVERLDAKGERYIVLDSKSILQDPESKLTELCLHLGLPFEASMLSWEAGARPEDGCWAKYWYQNVHRSTGFQKYAPKEEPFPDCLRPLLAECMPYYEKLMALAS